MAEYIDRNRLIKKFCNHCYFDVGEKNCAEDCYDMKIIKSLPTEDVQPVKHGSWIEYPECLRYENAFSSDHIVCSCCEAVFNVLDNCTECFVCCPNCGARMDGEV